MASNITRTIYYFIISSLGIRIKLIDFNCDEINRKPQAPFKKRFLKWISAVVFLIFIIAYPKCISYIINYSYIENTRKFENFLYTLNVYMRYFTAIIICISEFVCKKRAIAYRNAIKRDLVQLQCVYSHFFGHLKGRTFDSKNWNKTLTNLTSLKTGQSLIIVLIIIVYNAFINGRILFRAPHTRISQIFETIVTIIPNLCITLLVLHFSYIYDQYTKIFGLLNEILGVISNDICNQLSMRTKKRKRFKYFVVATMNEHKLNTNISHLATVLECHNNLKANLLRLRAIYSFELGAVILNGFIAIIIQVETNIFKILSKQSTTTITFSLINCSFSFFMKNYP